VDTRCCSKDAMAFEQQHECRRSAELRNICCSPFYVDAL
jgi:hypothetical protein